MEEKLNKILRGQVILYKMLSEIQDKSKGRTTMSSLANYQKELDKEIEKLNDDSNKGKYSIA